MSVTVIPLSVQLSLLPRLIISILQSSDRQEDLERGDDSLADKDATPPPLRVKLTVYRLVVMTTVLSFGAAKSVITYKSQSIAPTTLDWVSGTFLIA